MGNSINWIYVSENISSQIPFFNFQTHGLSLVINEKSRNNEASLSKKNSMLQFIERILTYWVQQLSILLSSCYQFNNSNSLASVQYNETIVSLGSVCSDEFWPQIPWSWVHLANDTTPISWLSFWRKERELALLQRKTSDLWHSGGQEWLRRHVLFLLVSLY